MQKTCGQLIYEIIKNMIEAGDTKLKSKRKTSYGININEVSERTGLNQSAIYRLNQPKARIPKSEIISFVMGLQLNSGEAEILMHANGMKLNINRPIDRAYIELMEKHTGRSIADCNAILRDLGVVTKNDEFLGSKERK